MIKILIKLIPRYLHIPYFKNNAILYNTYRFLYGPGPITKTNTKTNKQKWSKVIYVFHICSHIHLKKIQNYHLNSGGSFGKPMIMNVLFWPAPGY